MRILNYFFDSAFFFVLRGFALAFLLTSAMLVKAQTPDSTSQFQSGYSYGYAQADSACMDMRIADLGNVTRIFRQGFDRGYARRDSLCQNTPALLWSEEKTIGGKLSLSASVGTEILYEDATYQGATGGFFAHYRFNAIPKLRLGAGVTSTYLNNAWMPKSNEKYGRNEAFWLAGGGLDIAYKVKSVNIDWTTVEQVYFGFTSLCQTPVKKYQNSVVKEMRSSPGELFTFEPYVELMAHAKKFDYSLKLSTVIATKDFSSLYNTGDKHKGAFGAKIAWSIYFGGR